MVSTKIAYIKGTLGIPKQATLQADQSRITLIDKHMHTIFSVPYDEITGITVTPAINMTMQFADQSKYVFTNANSVISNPLSFLKKLFGKPSLTVEPPTQTEDALQFWTNYFNQLGRPMLVPKVNNVMTKYNS